MSTSQFVLLTTLLALSLFWLLGPENWLRKLSTLRYRSRFWLRLVGLIGVVLVGLLVAAWVGPQRFGISASTSNACRYLAGFVSGIVIGLLLARLTLRLELGDQLKLAPELEQD
ncbi:MAG: hypothetical protein ABMA26_16215 [Limisphaerales bacterium]